MKACISISLILLILCSGCDPTSSSTDINSGAVENQPLCTFMVAGDIRGYAGKSYTYNKYIYFRGACEEAKPYNPDFVAMTGDQDPPENAEWTINQYLGIPVVFTVGNHDAASPDTLSYINNNNRQLNIIGMSNKKMYKFSTCSFDFQNCHFLFVDQYLDSNQSNPKPELSNELLSWIENDLKNSTSQYKFVIGHVPYANFPDADTGLTRKYDLRDEIPIQAEKFWRILSQNGVNAYFCGHSHVYNCKKIGNTWQINPGVALIDTATDTEGNVGGFCVVQVTTDSITLNSWRGFDGKYTLKHIIDITN